MNDGSVCNAIGKTRKLQITKSGTGQNPIPYYVFNVGIGNSKRYPVKVHRLLAFQLFGEDALKNSIHTRHLDGNSLNNTPQNIRLGTGSENAMDRCPKERRLHAQKASRSASRHTDETWAEVRADHKAGLGYKKLKLKYGISPSSLSYQLSKTGKYRTLTNR